MLIPSIDLMGGKIVQLVQGQRKALEFANFSVWTERFSSFPIVQLIDLDAAMGSGSNRELVEELCGTLPCQVGGGLRSMDRIQAAFDYGAKKAIIGSSLIQEGVVDTAYAQDLSERFGPDRLVFAVDARCGQVAIQGWKTLTTISPQATIRQLEPFCSAFLYTHIDTEGLMQGIPLNVVQDLRQQTSRALIVAGGIRSRDEVESLAAMGVDAVVGMAIYSGLMRI